ncbi:MAG TPA: hypothetical protein VLF41_00655 [Candidatus Nanoarchaeia archaeon]|nr:hypothetical protein [Candidatus Nanoarchaeia archaeon]
MSTLHVFVVSTFLFAMAVVVAIMEIETEGKHGWAQHLPTWYRTEGRVAQLYIKSTGRPALTGYHAAITPLPFLIFLLPMVYTSHFSLAGVLMVAAIYFVWTIVWDFSWFALNPHYGVAKFRRNRVWWFSQERWHFGRVPESYIKATLTSLAFATLSGAASGGAVNGLTWSVEQIGWYLVFTALLVRFGAPAFRKYYWHMRQQDHRGMAPIFDVDDA